MKFNVSLVICLAIITTASCDNGKSSESENGVLTTPPSETNNNNNNNNNNTDNEPVDLDNINRIDQILISSQPQYNINIFSPSEATINNSEAIYDLKIVSNNLLLNIKPSIDQIRIIQSLNSLLLDKSSFTSRTVNNIFSSNPNISLLTNLNLFSDLEKNQILLEIQNREQSKFVFLNNNGVLLSPLEINFTLKINSKSGNNFIGTQKSSTLARSIFIQKNSPDSISFNFGLGLVTGFPISDESSFTASSNSSFAVDSK